MLSKLEQEIERIARHITILRLVVEEGPIGIIRLSELSKCPQHKVRYSLRILEQKNLIKPSSQGAMATPKAKNFMKALPRRIRKLSEKLENL